ncbi:efflux RND transporter periplasmic adaptor subunit [Robertkochia sediminum]|uniref:efflux RND transporter periplasmic adaptor subunit n=1 Tax=Robertkochia sediminum TaxID=2785326 RepID=UPI001932B834|nr:efflux RND transporter periplasmic adaptor subunit [Robertkochia sediminum]MBL7474090.1 efflux RND transporter periplasmic adaptor subunit [Robertkochia sediminum]
MKKKLYTLLFTTALLVTACGHEEEVKTTKSTEAVPVTIRTVAEGNDQRILNASGTVQAVKSANLSTRMMGFVESVKVGVGQTVREGQLLLVINDADIEAKRARVEAGIIEAETAFENAKKDHDRFNKLFAENSASQKEVDDITARYRMAEARLESARQMMKEVNAQMAYSRIKAPFNGVITGTYVKEGDMANPGQPLVAVEGQGALEVTALVPESEISGVAKDQEVNVQVRSVAGVVSGKVTELSTSSRNTGGQFMVKVALENPREDILPGMYATVQFPVSGNSNAQQVSIPVSALVHRGQLTGVYTLSENNTALLRWLRLGRTSGDNVEVLSGLSAGESYIVPGATRLYNGIKVTNKNNQ